MSYTRKSIRLKNRTNYFSPEVSKSHNSFSSPNSYQSKSIKIEGYESRLYWEFRYCDEHSGQTFFYTFTYNDKSIPVFDGQNVFNYDDLRYLLNGGLKKILLRKYGTNFKYFVGAELGEGEGSRGYHNNPHYHILFFLRPADDSRYPYKPISAYEFRHLCRMYWQGFDEAEGKVDYRTAKFGIAREGQNLGKVIDFRAISYVAKYVCKDAYLKSMEKGLEGEDLKEFRNKYSNKCRVSQGVGDYALQFIKDELNPTIQVPSKKGWKNRPISMYYYRKLYTKVVKDAKGQPIRILNERGIKYKCSKLQDCIDKVAQQAEAYYSVMDKEVYNKILYNIKNERTSFNLTYDNFIKSINNNKKIFNDYAKFKCVYEDRFFKYNGEVCDIPRLDCVADYKRFITPVMDKVSYCPNRLDLFLESGTEGYLSYSLHPYFLPNIHLFGMLDTITDYFFAETDKQMEEEAEERRRVRKFHKQREVKDFYASNGIF